MRQENFLVVKPLQMETEKASMERPMAIRNSSRKDIFVLLWRKNKTFFYRIDKKPIFAVCRAVTWWQPQKTNNKGCRGTTALQTDNKNN